MSKFWTKRNSNKYNNLFDYDYLLIPINSNNLHWSLVLLNLHNKKFTYYDSLEDEEKGFIIMNSLTKLFTEYITRVKDCKEDQYGVVNGGKRKSPNEEEVNNKLSTTLNSSTNFYTNGKLNNPLRSNIYSDDYESESESDIDMMASFWKFKIAETPKQENGVDCGVFMCKFMDYLARDEIINFTQEDIDYFRYLIGIEFLEGKLLTE
jgi:Ulp1 family protease